MLAFTTAKKLGITEIYLSPEKLGTCQSMISGWCSLTFARCY